MDLDVPQLDQKSWGCLKCSCRAKRLVVKDQSYSRKLPTVDNVRFSSPFTRPNLSWLTPTHFDMPGVVSIWDGEHLNTWSQIKQEDPLNLSISISGGKETNRDSPSNGE